MRALQPPACRLSCRADARPWAAEQLRSPHVRPPARPPAAQPLPASPLPSAPDPRRPRRSPRRRRRGGQTRFGWGCQAGRDSRESWPPIWRAPTADKRRFSPAASRTALKSSTSKERSSHISNNGSEEATVKNGAVFIQVSPTSLQIL